MIAIEPLAPRHDRSRFTSGQPALDAWFRRRGMAAERDGRERTFVALDAKLGIIGVYGLSHFTLTAGRDAVPAAMIGRRGRDERVQGGGVGELLLADAVRRILAAACVVPLAAILADAQDDHAAEFYSEFGFRPFPSRKLRLFLPLAEAAAALAKGQ